MPRSARIILPNCPHYVIQRGHNRSDIYFETADYHYYLDNLYEAKQQFGVKLYAYCLMPGYIQLILDPGDHPDNLGLLMKRISARHTRHINVRQRRTGSLWDSRYKSSPIEAENYFLSCCRYVENAPMYDGLTQLPQDYLWSSYAHRTEKYIDRLVDPFPEKLLSDKMLQQAFNFYCKQTPQVLSAAERTFIYDVIFRGQIIGGREFVEEVEIKVGRRVWRRPPGRPRKKSRTS